MEKSQKSTACFQSFKVKNYQEKKEVKKLAYLGVLVTVLVQLFTKVKKAWKCHPNSFWKAEVNFFVTVWK